MLCNPPFEDFSDAQRQQYEINFIPPPAELLDRVLRFTPANAEIGFVLPHQVIDGQAYSNLRRRIAERFSRITLVHLPEGVFQKARFPSALLIARDPTSHRHTKISFSFVSNARAFVERGEIDRTAIKMALISELENSLLIPELGDLWGFLSGHAQLQSAVNDIARGVEWERDTAGHVLHSPRAGTLPGFHTSNELRCFESPPLSFLVPEDKLYRAWDRPWHLPKVVCNAVRKRQRGPWKLAACPVDLNLVSCQVLILG